MRMQGLPWLPWGLRRRLPLLARRGSLLAQTWSLPARRNKILGPNRGKVQSRPSWGQVPMMCRWRRQMWMLLMASSNSRWELQAFALLLQGTNALLPGLSKANIAQLQFRIS